MIEKPIAVQNQVNRRQIIRTSKAVLMACLMCACAGMSSAMGPAATWVDHQLLIHRFVLSVETAQFDGRVTVNGEVILSTQAENPVQGSVLINPFVLVGANEVLVEFAQMPSASTVVKLRLMGERGGAHAGVGEELLSMTFPDRPSPPGVTASTANSGAAMGSTPHRPLVGTFHVNRLPWRVNEKR